MRASSYIHYLAILALLGACSSKDSKLAPTDPSNQATFVVDQIDKGSVQDSKTDAVYSSLSTEKQISFAACIRDVAMLEPVIGQEFRVLSDTGIIAVRKTDQSGCFSWTENYSINALADETYTQTDRTIEAVSFHKGSQKIPLAINPLSKGDAIIDTRYRTPPKLVSKHSGQQKSSFADNALFIESAGVEIQINQTNSSGASGVMRLKMQPKIRRIGLDGRKLHETLQQGKFRIQTQVLANNNSRLNALSRATDSTVEFSDGQVYFETPIQLLEIPNERTVELLLSIEAIDAPVPIGKQVSLLTVGRINRVLTNASGDLRPLSMSTAKIEMGELLQNNAIASGAKTNSSDDNIARADSAPAVVNPGNTRNMSFNIDKVKVAKVFPMNISPSTGLANRVRIEFMAKVTNGISNEAIINQRFQIEEVGEKRYAIDSDQEGMLHWAAVIDFSSIANEKYFKKTFKFKIDDTFYADSEIERILEINPWQYAGNPDLLLVDTKFNQAPTLEANNGLPEIILDNLDFEFKKRDFEIDNKLNFTVLRNFEIKIKPKIKRLTAMGWREESIGNGKYNLKVMLELQGHEDIPLKDRYLYSRIVETVNDGTAITAKVEFPFDDLPNVVNRNLLSVELIPVGNHTRFAAKSFSGNFIAIQEKGSISLYPKTTPIQDAGLAQRKAAANALIASADPIKLFLSRFRIEPVAEAEYASRWKVTEGERVALVTNPAQAAASLAKFCPRYYSGEALAKCQKAPTQYIDYLPTEHVRKINNKPKLVASDVINITISTAFTFSESNSEDSNQGSSLRKEVDSSTRGGVTMPFGSAGVSMSYGKAWYEATSKSKGKSHSAGTQVNAGKTINADEIVFRVNALITRCLVVSPKLKASVPNAPAGMHVCDSKPITKDIIEKYFYVYLFFRASTSPIVDASGDPIERPWTVLIRGEKRFDAFRRALEDSSGYLQMKKTVHTPGSVLSAAESKFDGLFPGLVTIE